MQQRQSKGPRHGLDSYYPCDQLRFPAACFRYFPFERLDVEDPCEAQTNPYAYRGCIYGYGFKIDHKDLMPQECNLYRKKFHPERAERDDYLACLAGYWHRYASEPPVQQFCSSLRFIDEQEICKKFVDVDQSFQTIPLGQVEFRWIGSILEEVFNQSLVIQPAVIKQ